MSIKIKYDNGIMILTHPSGYVNKYTIKDIEKYIKQIKKKVTELTTVQSDMTLTKLDILGSIN